MGMMLRRKHMKATRRVASFGLAFGSKYKMVENYKQIMLKYLNMIFDVTNQGPEQDKLEVLVKELHNVVN